MARISNRQKELPPRRKTFDAICPACKVETVFEHKPEEKIVKCGYCPFTYRVDTKGRPAAQPVG